MKVSVIIPVYNTGEYLKTMMDSVLNQTLKDIEIIPVDDGSTDGTIEKLKEYAARDERFKPIFNKHEGEKIAVDAGRDAAKGEYICICDHDDFMTPKALELLYECSGGEAEIVKGTALSEMDGKLVQSNAFKSEEPIDWRKCGQGMLIAHFLQPPELWSMILRRDFQKDIELGNYWFNDTDFVFKAKLMAHDFRYIPDPVYYWRIHPSVSHSTDHIFDVVKVYDSLEKWMKENGYSLWHIFSASRFNAYAWNMNRLADEDKRRFMEVFKRDAKRDSIIPWMIPVESNILYQTIMS